MAGHLDSRVASVIDQHGLDEDEDELIAELENDHALDGFRERRLEQLHAEYKRAQSMKKQEHGTYSEIKEEKALMDITTSTRLCIVHFFKSDFNRCRIMDGHLQTLASKHFDTRFLRIDVDNAPFLVVKLKVQVLPCVLMFIDGVSKDRLVGFEGIGYSGDAFSTKELETRLLQAGVLLRPTTNTDAAAAANRPRESRKEPEHDGDDDDWD